MSRTTFALLMLGLSACGSAAAPTGWNCNDNSPSQQALSCVCLNSAESTDSGVCPYTACCIKMTANSVNTCECFDASYLSTFETTCQTQLNFRVGEGFTDVYFVGKCP